MVRAWAIGDVVVTAVADIDPFEIALNRLFPAADPIALESLRDLLVPDHLDAALALVRLAVQTFVLSVDGQTILVDTCVGEHKPRPRLAAWNERDGSGFLDRLAVAGVDPLAVDLVFCTHLHADHVGWNTLQRDGRWVPTFPNARYLFGRREYEHWSQHRGANHGSFEDSVLPIVEARQMMLVDNGYAVARGVTLVPLPGHSPGQMGLMVDRGQERALFCGDAIHSPLQVVQPHLCSAFCADASAAIATRQHVLEAAADDGWLLVPAHFRRSGRAHIRRIDGSYVPAFAGEQEM